MRGFALTVTLLLLAAPLALAQADDGDSGESGESSTTQTSPPPNCDRYPSGSPEKQRCLKEAHCRQAPSDPACKPAERDPADNGTDREDADDSKENRTEERPDGFCAEANRTSEKARCERAVQGIKRDQRREWITFRLDAGNKSLDDYTVDGLLAVDQVILGLDDGNLSIDRQGSLLRVRDASSELRLHDEPNGLIWFKGDANVTLDFPPNVILSTNDGGARINYGSGRQGLLLAENATWLPNNTVRLHGFFAFHVPPAEKLLDEKPREVVELDAAKQKAIGERRFAAEISLKREDAASIAAGDDAVQVQAYDDIDVEVDLPVEEAVPDAPVRVVVSSDLHEGRTIVVNLDEGLLASTAGEDLVLHYYDLHNQTDGSVLETEVVFKAASDLDDVLDPTDDGGQPEYWVVEDANGVQVLVSVPHWSSHAITVASIANVLHAPSVTVGIVVGAAASVAMGALLLWPRRRDDE